jgi:hypothetical protein
MSQLAPLVDVMWGGTVSIGPLIKYSCSIMAAQQIINTNLVDKDKWNEALGIAVSFDDGTPLGAATIVEFDDGTVKVISTKNYLELCRRTYPDKYPSALSEYELSLNADSGPSTVVGDESGADAAVSSST